MVGSPESGVSLTHSPLLLHTDYGPRVKREQENTVVRLDDTSDLTEILQFYKNRVPLI